MAIFEGWGGEAHLLRKERERMVTVKSRWQQERNGGGGILRRTKGG